MTPESIRLQVVWYEDRPSIEAVAEINWENMLMLTVYECGTTAEALQFT